MLNATPVAKRKPPLPKRTCESCREFSNAHGKNAAQQDRDEEHGIK